MPDRRTELSKAVARALRHTPERLGLRLDEGGWTPTAELVDALRAGSPRWRSLDVAEVEDMVRRSSKRRYELAGGRIRARYGHSLPGLVVVGEPQAPPAVLFHGTSPAVVPVILTEGLRPMRRQYVHLSTDEETAAVVGRRRSRTPALLRVRAGAAARDGVRFYPGNEQTWLAEHVPSPYLEVVSG